MITFVIIIFGIFIAIIVSAFPILLTFIFLDFLSLYFILCSYHVTYAFQNESTLCGCLTVKELIDQNRREI